jgi:hypothetical protein
MDHLAHYMFHSAGAFVGAALSYLLLGYESSCTTVPGSLTMHCETLIGTTPLEPLAALGLGAVVGVIAGGTFGGWMGEELG